MKLHISYMFVLYTINILLIYYLCDKKISEYKPQNQAEQLEQSTSVEELEQQVLKQNELAKSVDTEETKQDDKK